MRKEENLSYNLFLVNCEDCGKKIHGYYLNGCFRFDACTFCESERNEFLEYETFIEHCRNEEGSGFIYGDDLVKCTNCRQLTLREEALEGGTWTTGDYYSPDEFNEDGTLFCTFHCLESHYEYEGDAEDGI